MSKKTKKQSKSKNPISSVVKKAAVPQKLQAVKRSASKIEPETIAKGAAAVSIAAGVIAAGVALMDKENRKKVSKMAGKGMEMMQDVAADMSKDTQSKYQAVAQRVPIKGSSSKKQTKRGRSKN